MAGKEEGSLGSPWGVLGDSEAGEVSRVWNSRALAARQGFGLGLGGGGICFYWTRRGTGLPSLNPTLLTKVPPRDPQGPSPSARHSTQDCFFSKFCFS